MPERDRTYRIFLSAAEPSADAHCAALVTTLKKSGYDIDFVGVGGLKMASAGCTLLETTATRAAMIYKAFSHVGHYYRLVKRITRFLKSSKVDLVIVCDSAKFYSNYQIIYKLDRVDNPTMAVGIPSVAGTIRNYVA